MEIRATRIVLEDASGKERIVMELDRGQPNITLFGATGDPQIVLTIDEGKVPRISLASPSGNPVIHLKVIDGPGSVGSALLHMLGDYTGEGRKEILVANGDSVSQPSIKLNFNGTTIAHLP